MENIFLKLNTLLGFQIVSSYIFSSLNFYIPGCFHVLLHKYCIYLPFSYAYYFSYIVKKDAPGLTATKIENKIGLRIVQNGDIVLKKVFVPDEDRIAELNSFQDTNKVNLYGAFVLRNYCVILSFSTKNYCKHLVVHITEIT